LLIRTLAPGRVSRFLHHSFDRVFFQLLHCFGNCLFKLRIVSADNIFRPVLDVDVGRDTFVFNCPFSFASKKSATWRDHRSAIDKRRSDSRVTQPAPRAFANKSTDLAIAEHIWHQVSARSRHFVDDHYFWSPDTRSGTGKRHTVTGNVVEVTIKTP